MIEDFIVMILDMASNDMGALRRIDSGNQEIGYALLGSNIRGAVEFLKSQAKEDEVCSEIMAKLKSKLEDLNEVL